MRTPLAFTRLWAALACWLALASTTAAHEITFSHIELRLGAGETRVEARLPIKALNHTDGAAPAVAAEPDLLATPLSPVTEAAIDRLIADRLRIGTDTKPLALDIKRVTRSGDEIVVEATAPAVFGPLAVSANLFPADSLHKVFVNVSRGDDLVGQYALDRQAPAFTLATPKQPLGAVIAAFIGQGVRHIAIGPDHILFVLALVLLGGSLGAQVKIVTAFTVAHSITLALATLGLVRATAGLVEPLIALSIVVVGLHDLRQLWRPTCGVEGRDWRAAFAFGFGLIHGFGFASVLAQLDLPREALAWSLAAFNIGVELGQLAIVLAAAPLLLALDRYAPPRAQRWVLTGAAAIVVIAGAVWLVQRL